MEIGYFLFIDDLEENQREIMRVCTEKRLEVKDFAKQELVRTDIKNFLQSGKNCALIMPNYDRAEWIMEIMVESAENVSRVILCDNMIVTNENAGFDFICEQNKNELSKNFRFILMTGGTIEDKKKQELEQLLNFAGIFNRSLRWGEDLKAFLEHFVKTGEIKIAERTIEFLSSLKHRIAHCFLSIDIDLQSAKEQSEYLEDILRTKQEGYYTYKLNQARCYAVGGEWCDCAEKKGKELNQPFRPPDNSILDLLKCNRPKEWSTVCILLGLSELNYSKETESHIVDKFFKELDEKIGRDLINARDILDYFIKITPDGWHVPNADPSYIKSFHDWFIALDEALDKLRASLTVDGIIKLP